MNIEQFKRFRPTEWVVENRTTVYIFTFMIVLFGSAIYVQMPKEQFPDIVVPQIYVQTIYAGTTPTDIENLISKPIEKQLKSTSGVKKVKSNSLQDVSVILVEFNTNVSVSDAKQRVKDAVDKARNDLPKDLKQLPFVQDVNFSEFPIMNVNIAGNFPLDRLKKFAEQLKDEIEGMPEISKVDMVGALKREIQINGKLARMQATGITFNDIIGAVGGENITMSGGELNVDNVRRSVQISGEYRKVEQIANLMLRSGTGATVRLGDIADVKDAFEEKQDYAHLNSKPVITLNIIKRGGTNLITASDRIIATIENYKANRFPQGLEVKITADQSDRTRSELADLINTVILGFIFVVLVLMFFMGVRDAIFVALSVPLSALMAFLFMPSLGFTLNTIVMFGFLLGLGIVVDDAIVVIENTHRLFNDHKDWDIKTAVKVAAGEVFGPVLSGTLTTLAPFFPLLFWPGIIGEFMKYLPITLIITLFASLFVAYVMNPVFAVSFMKRHEEEHTQRPSPKTLLIPTLVFAAVALLGYLIHKGVGNFVVAMWLLYIANFFVITPLINAFQNGALVRFRQGYQNLISWSLTGKRYVGVVVASFLLLVLTFILMGKYPPNVVLFPSGEPDYTYIYTKLPIGTDARITDSVTKVIEKRVFEVIGKNNPAINSVISNVGLAAGDPMNPDRGITPHKSKVTVAYQKSEKRIHLGFSSSKMMEKIRENLKGIPGAEISVEKERNGPPTGKAISIEIAGDDFGTLKQLETSVKSAIAQAGIKGIDELKSDLTTNKPEIRVEIDREKANREGISSQSIAMAIRTSLYGVEVSKFRDEKDEYPIMLRLAPSDRQQIEQILNQNITYRDMNMGGALRQIPLNAVAKIGYAHNFNQINRKNQERVVTLSSDPAPGYANNVNNIVQQIQEVLNEMNVPEGYTVRIGGEQDDMKDSMIFLAEAFLGAILLIYLILATQFNSVVKPLITFATIILSLIGVFIGFIITGKTMSIIMSGVGIISLAGIVVKNGILLIEFTDELRSRGYETRRAIIEAGSIRLTPVLLTAAAAVLGLIPLAIGMNINFVTMFTELDPQFYTGGFSQQFWGPLAWTIIYGLTFSTILTLVVVPCMYWFNERVQERFLRKKA